MHSVQAQIVCPERRSEPTAKNSIRYEQPAVVRRDTIAGLLDGAAPSGSKTPPTQDTAPPLSSDVNVKENIRLVRW